MNIDSFLEKLNNTPQEITFAETIAVIEDNYNFTYRIRKRATMV
jgi:hypothetical protein